MSAAATTNRSTEASTSRTCISLLPITATPIAARCHWEPFEELEVLGQLHPASHRALGGDAYGRLSADGREHLRTIDNHS